MYGSQVYEENSQNKIKINFCTNSICTMLQLTEPQRAKLLVCLTLVWGKEVKPGNKCQSLHKKCASAAFQHCRQISARSAFRWCTTIRIKKTDLVFLQNRIQPAQQTASAVVELSTAERTARKGLEETFVIQRCLFCNFCCSGNFTFDFS